VEHLEQEDDLEKLKYPTGHTEQEDEPLCSENFPASQERQNELDEFAK
jgi:hypothetical protein